LTADVARLLAYLDWANEAVRMLHHQIRAAGVRCPALPAPPLLAAITHLLHVHDPVSWRGDGCWAEHIVAFVAAAPTMTEDQCRKLARLLRTIRCTITYHPMHDRPTIHNRQWPRHTQWPAHEGGRDRLCHAASGVHHGPDAAA